VGRGTFVVRPRPAYTQLSPNDNFVGDPH
jgi:hypothetical protein